MRVVGIIPVRLESKRLPDKALKDICGIPMILHTFKRAQLCNTLDELYVATDNQQIYDLIIKNNGKAIMTSTEHQVGTDRIAEAAQSIDCDIVVNIQGDEALLNPQHITTSVEGLIQSEAQISLLLTKFTKKNSHSDIKAVINLKNEIMYLSRSDIPFTLSGEFSPFYKAYHLVSFRKDFLLKYPTLDRTPLEITEANEYLRVLQHGYKIQGVFSDSDSISVDTLQDLEYVRERMMSDRLYPLYRDSVIIE